ncbi:PKD domain-containing protein [Rubrivirga sp. S365]|uniref:PKD domain-containing protein n=1 Tax=Rubrivirga litoralis TaxID=3075598 RepID=A0ABU3BPB2_9BACT|nr:MULTISPECIES: PKD domain-containing protein [unclassified Rubrivirga]MDT0631041.1 PKD domain-containing protein [Rubrivirga sp. F394]MDT7855067.1 PKD domain-containing protein [Rubrivirga sp. S365]
MPISSRFRPLLLGTLALAAGLTACDNFEDNLDFEAGDSRTIVGASSVEVAPEIRYMADTTATGVTITSVDVETDPTTTVPYYIQAYTIDQTYAWNVEGPGNPTGVVRRDGEYYDVTFGTRGAYTVTVSDGTYAGTEDVTVTEPPSVGACAATSSSLVRNGDNVTYRVVEGDPITFSAVTAGRLDSEVSITYGVDGPDADTAPDVVPVASFPVTYTYPEAGSYDATIVVENEDGSDSCTLDIEVREPVTISECTAQPSAVPVGGAVQFNGVVNSLVGDASVSVDYGNGVTANNVSLPLQYTYNTAGTYTATITAANARSNASCTVGVTVGS